MPRVLARDPFNAVLLDSPALLVTPEQDTYIKEILAYSSSDSAFAMKAYKALTQVLTSAPVVPPVVSGVTPTTAVVGDPPLALVVTGTGFTATSVVNVSGLEIGTTFVSETELHATYDIGAVIEPTTLSVAVVNDGVISDPVYITISAPVLMTASTEQKKSFDLPKSGEKKLTVEEHYSKDKK